MTEYTVIQVFAFIAGLFVTIGVPIIKLNNTITELNANVKSLDRRFAKFEDDNKDSHKRMWLKLTEHDDTLNDHETRMQFLEKK